MGKPQPIAVGERTAAGMLDMRPNRFRELVNKGALPPPSWRIDNEERWLCSDLIAAMQGKAAIPTQDEFE